LLKELARKINEFLQENEMDTSTPRSTMLNTEMRNFSSAIMGVNYQIST